MGILSDCDRDKRIALLEKTAATATQVALDAQSRCATLEERLEQLSSQSQAMAEFLRKKYTLPDTAFVPPPEPPPAAEASPPELYGPVPPPPILVCINCNTRFQNINQTCPNCRYRTITNTPPTFKPHFDK